MDNSQVLELVRRFAERARESLDVREVILFGSYARGTATETSDIDVAVVIDTPVDDWWEASTKLFQMRRDLALALEPVLLDASADRSGFLEEIRRTGQVIYRRV